jgi:serine/threonine protein kinase/tetratricopeptide (TPR) repeat protein
LALRGDPKVVAEEWERVKELFESALNCTADERPAFLARLEQEYPQLAAQVSRLLASHEQAGDFMLQPLILPDDFLDELEQPQRFSADEILCNRFRIIRLIGKGGMGEVYEASDQELEEHVALKTLRFEVSSNEIFNARFRREIQLARKVTHSNVCRIFESLRHQDGNETISVLSMELLRGQTLSEYLKTKGRLTADEALPLARQIIDGLSAVHAAGIIHRDLKPSNLVLVPDSDSFCVKITDFGIAGRLPENPSQPTLTQASKMLGTPDYMAPEQLEHGRATMQSDIYALGLVLYEMVTGAKPFGGAGAWKRLTEDAPPPRKSAPDLPANWNRTIACCLERTPEYRFSSAGAVAESLKEDAPPTLVPRKPLLTRLSREIKPSAMSITVLLVLLVVAALMFRFLRPKQEMPQIAEGSRMLFTFIDNRSHDSQLDGATEVLRNQLSQSAYTSLLDEQTTRETLRRMARDERMTLDSKTAREVAMRNSAPLVLFGLVSRNSEIYDLDLELDKVGSDPDYSKATWRFHESASNKDQLLAVLGRGASWVRRMAGETEIELDQRNRPPEDVTTNSWEALQLYSDARKMAMQDRLNEAVLLYKRATDKDPNFAMAWMGAGDTLDTLGQSSEGLKCWKKALEVSGTRRLTPREELRIKGMYANDTGDLESAVKFFSQYSVAYPNDYLGYFDRGYPLMLMGRVEEAIQVLIEAERLNPNSYYTADHLARYNLITADFAQSARYTQRVRELGHPDYADQVDGQASFLKGDYQHALELFSGLRRSKDPYLRSVSFYLEASVLAELGKYTEAIQTLRRGIAADLPTGDSSDRADKLLALAYILLRTGDHGGGRDAVMSALDADRSPARVSAAGVLLVRSGFIPEAKRLLRAFSEESVTPIERTSRMRLEGEILLADGHASEALTILKRENQLNQAKALLSDSFPRALFSVGKLDEALREYAQLLSHPGQVWGEAASYPPGFCADLLFHYARVAFLTDSPDAQTRLAEYVRIRGSTDPAIAEVTQRKPFHSSRY